MKELLKKISVVLVTVLLLVGNGTAARAEDWVGGNGSVPKNTDKGTITVSDVEDDVTVTAYQVVKATYGANNEGFLGYEVVSGVAIADPLKPTSEEITAIAGGNKSGLTSQALTYKPQTKTWSADVAPGYWVVIVTKNSGEMDYIYNPILAGVYYKDGNVKEYETLSDGGVTYDVYTYGTKKYVQNTTDDQFYEVVNGVIQDTPAVPQPTSVTLSKKEVKVDEKIDGQLVYTDGTKKYVQNTTDDQFYEVVNGVIQDTPAVPQPDQANLTESKVNKTGDILVMNPTPISADSNWSLAGTQAYAKRDQITPEKKIVDNSKANEGADVATNGRTDGLNNQVTNQHGDDHAPADEVSFQATTKIPAYSEAYRAGTVTFELNDEMDAHALKLLVGEHANPAATGTLPEEKEAIEKIHGGKTMDDSVAPATSFHKIVVEVGTDPTKEIYAIDAATPYTQKINKKVAGENVKTNGTDEYVVLTDYDHDADPTTDALTGNYKVDGRKLADPLAEVTPGQNDTDVLEDAFTLSYTANTWKIAFAKDYIIDHAGADVCVKYDALALEGMKTNFAENKNTFKVKYSTDTNGGYEEDEDRTFHYTFEIDGKLDGETEDGGNHTKRLGHELVKTNDNFDQKVDKNGVRYIKYTESYKDNPTDADFKYAGIPTADMLATTPALLQGVFYEGTYDKDADTFTFTQPYKKAVQWDGEQFTEWTSGVVKMGLDDAEFKLTYKALPDGTAVANGKEYTTKTVAGRMNFKGLDAGYYELEETKAPDGYSLNPTKITVKISAKYYQENQYHKVNDNGVKLYVQADGTTEDTMVTATPAMTTDETPYLLFYKGELESYSIERAEGAYTNAGAFTPTEKTVYEETRVADNSGKITSTIEEEFTGAEATFIKNTKNPLLPSTGGIGTYIFTIAGVAILAIASFMLLKKKQNA